MASLSDLDAAIQGFSDALASLEAGIGKVDADLVALKAKLSSAGQTDFASEVASIQGQTAKLVADTATVTASDADANS